MPKYEATKNGRRVGRPCGLTPEVHKELVKAIQLGATVKIATRAAGVSDTAYYQWLARGRADIELGDDTIFSQFTADIERASGKGDVELLSAVRVKTQGTRCPTCRGRGAVPASEVGGAPDDHRYRRCPACYGSGFGTTPDGKLALDFLARRHPEDYGRKDNKRHVITGPQGGPVQVDVRAVCVALDVAAMSPAQLAAMAYSRPEQIETKATLPPRRQLSADVLEADAALEAAAASVVSGTQDNDG